jgi:hypothetical protein
MRRAPLCPLPSAICHPDACLNKKAFRPYIQSMSTIAEIESAIEKLSPQEQNKLRDWLIARDGTQKPVLERLRSLAGKARNLPDDLAANHDHYLHGTAKRS